MSLSVLTDVPAPAKLNLFLHVVGRRANGYHLLQSLFVLIDWCDRLHFERRDDGRLLRHDLGEPLPADDLCLRAARALQSASGTTFGADISIDKQVPSGAGMGGGSSDAASTLLALNRLWGVDWPRAKLLELALPLGADVPFFIGGHNAFVEGIGERLTPTTLAARDIVVLKPQAGVETRALFASPLLSRKTEAAILAGFPGNAQLWIETQAKNDLQAAAEQECPEITQALRLLRDAYGNSRMTGSGSAVFAYDDGQKQDSGMSDRLVATSLAALPPGWVARKCRSLEIHPLYGWARD
jgi:4-diphosphocytidyl-2-C-methyl-D-erythritol kinase